MDRNDDLASCMLKKPGINRHEREMPHKKMEVQTLGRTFVRIRRTPEVRMELKRHNRLP